MAAETTPVWFITGCTTGFGRVLAQQVLAKGLRAVVTGRGRERIADLVKGAEDRAIALDLDVNDAAQIKAAVDAALARFGAIDVLVNNAGYGYQASVEEGDDAQIRAQFDANVFGLFAMTRAVLPAMRKQRRGHIINISSVAGLVGFAGSAFYAASKHAVEGFSDSLAAEVAALGIKVTCIEPGPFRTEWAGRSLRQDAPKIGDYADTAQRMAAMAGYSGEQPGNPAKAAEAMIAVYESPTPPRHIVLGAFGIDAVTKALKARLDEIESQRAVALAADFPKD